MTDQDLPTIQRWSKPPGRSSTESERGPPADEGASASTSSNQGSKQKEEQVELLRKQVKERDAEINILQQELQVQTGKIKGYQTLSHLFQESKQTCSRYKQKNDELSLQLDIMMKRFSNNDDENLEINKPAELEKLSQGDTVILSEPLTSCLTTIVEGTSKHAQNSKINNDLDMTCESTKMCDHNTGRRDLTISLSPSKESGDKTGQGKPELSPSNEECRLQSGDQSKNHSPASTNSFVQISNPETEHSERDDLEVDLHSIRQNQPIARLHDCTLMEEIHQIAEHLSQPLHSGVGDSQAITADLLHLGVKAMKIEKQFRVKQV